MGDPHESNLSLSRRRCCGLSLLELLVTIAISLVLGTITSVSYTGILNRAERVSCTANLRALHAAFSGYTLDRGSWPQEPPLLGSEGSEFYGWLASELETYGGSREVWLCPTERRRQIEGEGEEEFVGSYTPTMFDTGQQLPWEWENQPWLVERANNHLTGQLILFPSGKVVSVEDFMQGK